MSKGLRLIEELCPHLSKKKQDTEDSYFHNIMARHKVFVIYQLTKMSPKDLGLDQPDPEPLTDEEYLACFLFLVIKSELPSEEVVRAWKRWEKAQTTYFNSLERLQGFIERVESLKKNLEERNEKEKEKDTYSQIDDSFWPGRKKE